MVDNGHTPHIDALYELWNEPGLPNLTAWLRGIFQHFLLFWQQGVVWVLICDETQWQ